MVLGTQTNWEYGAPYQYVNTRRQGALGTSSNLATSWQREGSPFRSGFLVSLDSLKSTAHYGMSCFILAPGSSVLRGPCSEVGLTHPQLMNQFTVHFNYIHWPCCKDFFLPTNRGCNALAPDYFCAEVGSFAGCGLSALIGASLFCATSPVTVLVSVCSGVGSGASPARFGKH
jgi:hypothetical protein